MTLKKCFAATLAFALSYGCAFAIPAKRGVRTVTQPDGTTINIMKTGDEFMHFTTTEDGYLLRQDEDGFYRIANVEKDGAIKATDYLPTRANLADYGTKLSSIDREALRVKRLAGNKRRVPQTGLGRSECTYPTMGNPKGLIILVEYSDVKFTTKAGYNPSDYFYDMINGASFTQFGGTGSALKYFQDQSGNKFSPEFEVLGPVTLPKKQSYYGANDNWGNDQHAEEMVIDGIKKLDPYTDFSEFDTDGDGVIDNVFVFYAGQGEADYGNANTVWPHSWDVRYGGHNVEVDGVLIGHYACSNEWEVSQPCGVGTFIHEFSHVMGLPDLYHTTDSYAFYTPGDYSVLDYGPYNNNGRTPPNYGAYEKNAMGWFEPIVMDGPATVTLDNITSGEFGMVSTSKTNEFFLFENRQQTGWDKYIPGHGMLIWHIDYNKNTFDKNEVNNNANHQCVDIVEANNQQNYYKYAAGYTFPGTSKKDSFTANTTPAFKDWSGNAIDLPITNIMESNDIISFDVAGGASVSAPVPTVKEYSRDNMYFTAEWEPVPGAKDYTLTVYIPSGNSASINNGFDGSNIGEGWQSNFTYWLDSYDRIGESAPSLGFRSNNETLTSPETSEDITGVKLWTMGSSGMGPTLKIEGLSDGEWVAIYEFKPKDLYEEETIELEEIPAGVRQIRFVMNRPQGSTGWIIIDDIVISYGSGEEVLPDYNNVSVGKSTEIKVDKLKDGIYEYYFTVAASDGTITRTSEPVKVVLDGEYKGASVGLSPVEDASPVYYNLQGIRIEKPEPGSIVIEAKGKVTKKIKF